MLRTIASAVLASAALLAAAGVQAETGPYYSATPTAASAKAHLITRSTAWSQQGGTFVAARAPERDMVLCQLVARDVGQLSAFSAGGKAYDADQLTKCNGKAATIATTVANN